MESFSNNHRDALHAYDPKRGKPPTDAIADATEAAMGDRELHGFWEAERAFDRALVGKLAAVPVPEGLADRILQAAASENQERLRASAPAPAAPTRNAWHWSAFAGAAAAVVFLAFLFTFVLNPFAARTSPELATMIARLETVLEERSAPMRKADDYAQLVSYLESDGAPVPKFIPAGLAKENGFACANFEIDGVPVGMMCFRIEDGVYHIFTLDRAHFPNQADLPREVVKHVGGHCCATWTKGDQVYILATTEPEEKLLTLL